MIRYSLSCADCGSEFEAWFGSSDAYDAQNSAGDLECPHCGGAHVGKQIMAPAVRVSSRTRNSDAQPMHTEPEADFAAFSAKARAYVATHFDYVGDKFTEIAKQAAKHETDTPTRPIWGETTPAQRAELAEHGIDTTPLPEAFVPPVKVPKAKLN